MKIPFPYSLLSGLIPLLLFCVIPSFASAQDNGLYDFDVESFTKKTWEWKGEVSLTGAARQYNTGSILHDFKFQGEEVEQSKERELNIFLESRWDWDFFRLVLSAEATAFRSTLEDSADDSAFLSEGYGQVAMLDPHTVEFGKRLLRWGKGYAFNPVAFMERAKNPEDPEAAREGLILSQGIWIIGKTAGFDNSSLTIVYLPVREGINDSFRGDIDFENGWGAKLYGLINTTDIDLYLVKWNETEETDWGIDFATNLTSSFEVHGEYAVFERTETTSHKALLGLRYLTERDVTWIVEGFHDSSGLSSDELAAVYKTIEGGSPAPAKTAVSRIQQNRVLSRYYAYLKVSVKEPFDWLYFTPSTTWLLNLDDSSHTETVQLAYSPFENWTFQASYQQNSGARYTQWGENAVRSKLSIDLVWSL